MARPRILLLLATTSYRADDFLGAAESVGADVVVGTDHEPVLSDLAPGGALPLSFARVEESVARIVEAAEDEPFDAVVAAEDPGVLVAAAAADALGLPHDPPEAVRAARDKHRFRVRMSKAGIPTPSFRLLELDGDAEEAARSVDFPCVIKPRSLSAGQGVIRADGPRELVRAARRVAAIVEGADDARRAATEGPGLLVESYVPGREVALEGLVDDGRLRVLALFDKPDPLEGPFFEETIFVTPSRLPESVRRRVVDTTRRAVRALGLTHGPVHAELRVDDDGVWPLEVAPRTIGGRCARVLRFGSGMTLEELVLRQAAGLEVPGWEREDDAVGVMMLPVPGEGILREVRGREDALAVPDIVGLEITIAPGRPVRPLPEGHRYLGFLFARAGDPGRVEEALREAHARLDVVLDGDAGGSVPADASSSAAAGEDAR